MAGHSHWAGIKHKKSIIDAKRGKIFSRIAKDIMIAVRQGGPDQNTNLRLRYAIDKAKAANMPKTNIERVLKWMKDKEANAITELTYEGYGPGGVAVMVDVLTDNRNRTASELRKIFDSSGGKMGESGCVAYMFTKKGFFSVPLSSIEEEALMDIIMEAGAEDLQVQDEVYEITCEPADFHTVQEALTKAEVTIEDAELVQIPQNNVAVDEGNAEKVLNLINKLEDQDDVRNVYANYDIAEEILAQFNDE